MFHTAVTYKKLSIAALIGAGALLSGCASTTPLDTYGLTVQNSASTVKSKKNVQVLIPAPNALQALDSQNIVISSAPGSIEYLKGAQWGDRLTNIVQSRLIESFENTGLLGGVGRPGQGLAINYQIQTDLRIFGVNVGTSPKTAIVEIAVKVVNDKNGEVRATRVFRGDSAVSGPLNNTAYVKALDRAFNKVAAEIVTWSVSVM